MRTARLAAGLLGALALAFACSTTEAPPGGDPNAITGGSAGTAGTGTGAGGTTSGSSGNSTGGLIPPPDADVSDAPGDGPMRDPNTCEEAVLHRTYLGCEYFPTVLGNVADPVFDFAVVVANPSDEAAMVHVEGPSGFVRDATVAARGLVTIALDWVPELKGPSLTGSGTADPFTASAIVAGGAYRLTATRPVAAYQFNPLEFQAEGGPEGKVWTCSETLDAGTGACDCVSDYECNSYSNDASLLLPKNALTSNYLAFGWHDASTTAKPAYVAVTATEDATEVVVKVGSGGTILAGDAASGIMMAGPGTVFAVTLNRGDVALLVASPGSDLSGTQVQASDPAKVIQVMSGNQTANVPDATVPSGDHLEEIVFPAEAVGRDYVVTVPTGPFGLPVRHAVRLYGHTEATALSYFPAKPAGAPDTLAPGSVATFETNQDFQVQGTTPFAVGSFLVGGSVLDPAGAQSQSAIGDPSQSLVTSGPQFRERYVFLAPADYQRSYVDIVAPAGTAVTLDGTVLDTGLATRLAGRNADGSAEQAYDVYRQELSPDLGGQHDLSATAPVGIQVVGYGRFTSYQYPGGLNLNLISEPPPVPEPPR